MPQRTRTASGLRKICIYGRAQLEITTLNAISSKGPSNGYATLMPNLGDRGHQVDVDPGVIRHTVEGRVGKSRTDPQGVHDNEEGEMEEPSTCGQGLASRSSLPGKLGELLAALARILEAHMRALDPTGAEARKELDAYATLVTAHRDVGDRLSGIAVQMADYRNLPIAPHDTEVMSDAVAHKAFENFVRLEHELATMLAELVQQDQQMLQQMAR